MAIRHALTNRRLGVVIVGATGVALGVAVGALGNMHSLWASTAMVAAVLVVAAVFVRFLGVSVGLVVLLIVACLLDRGTFSVGRFDIRAEQVAALLTLAVLSYKRLSDLRFLWLRPSLTEAALAAWFAVGLISSLTVAPSRSESLKILALLVISSLGLLLPRRLLEQDRKDQDEIVRWLLLAIAMESAYAVAAYLLHLLGPTVSVSLNPGTNLVSAYGTLWEPNVLGAVCAAGAVAWFVLGRMQLRHSWIGVALCASATVVSFARAAWLALALVIILAAAVKVGRGVEPGVLVKRVGAAVVVVGAVVAVGVIGRHTTLLTNLSRSIGSSMDIVGRLNQFKIVLADLRSSPVLGGGIDSYGQRHVYKVPEHLANLELAVASDTGVVGVVVFAAFAVLIVVAVWRKRHDITVTGLAATNLVLVLTNQATETLELMVTWLLLGLLLAAVETAPVPARATDRATSSESRLSTSGAIEVPEG